MEHTQTSRPLARVGRILFGVAVGAATSIVAVIVITISNDTTVGVGLALLVLFYGAPIAMLFGAVTGALWPSNARVTVPRALHRDQARRLRDAPLAAWVMGVLGGLAAFVAYCIVTGALLFLLGAVVGTLFPIAWLALIPVIWTSVRTATDVIRSVDARIRARELGGS
jgi:hypothetical protein